MQEKTLFLPIAEAYDRWSQGYDLYDNPMVSGASRVVESLGPAVAGADVFEFGCGTGRNLQAAKRLGASSVAGCDLSPGMLEVARRHDPALRLLLHDMTRPLPLEDRSVDCSLFCLTLEHLSGLAAPLREAKRLLRPMGRIEIIEIHPYVSMGGVAAHFQHSGETVQMPTFAHSFSDYLNCFAGLGLHVAACKEWRPTHFGEGATEKMFKRGADHPLLVQFSLVSEFQRLGE